MSNLGAGIDLEAAVKELEGLARLVALLASNLFQGRLVGAGKQRRGRGHVQQLEHLAAEVGGVGAAGDGDADARGAQAVQHRGHVAVKGESLAYFVGAGAAVGVGFQRGIHVRVYPERPQGVVEVKDDQARQWLAVGQDGWE